MAWFTRQKGPLDDLPPENERRVRTEGLWQKCEHCGQIIWRKALEESQQVCPKCGWHFRIDARTRTAMLLDPGWQEFDADLVSSDPLEFVDSRPYQERLASMQAATGMRDAVIASACP